MAVEGIVASVLSGREELAAFYVVFLSGLKDVSITSPVIENIGSCFVCMFVRYVALLAS